MGLETLMKTTRTRTVFAINPKPTIYNMSHVEVQIPTYSRLFRHTASCFALTIVSHASFQK